MPCYRWAWFVFILFLFSWEITSTWGWIAPQSWSPYRLQWSFQLWNSGLHENLCLIVSSDPFNSEILVSLGTCAPGSPSSALLAPYPVTSSPWIHPLLHRGRFVVFWWWVVYGPVISLLFSSPWTGSRGGCVPYTPWLRQTVPQWCTIWIDREESGLEGPKNYSLVSELEDFPVCGPYLRLVQCGGGSPHSMLCRKSLPLGVLHGMVAGPQGDFPSLPYLGPTYSRPVHRSVEQKGQGILF